MWRSSVANSSPRVLSSPRSPQRAAAVCSMTSTVSPRGQARCTLTASTHGSVWIARAHRREIHRQQPRAVHLRSSPTRSTSPGATRWKRPSTATDSIG